MKLIVHALAGLALLPVVAFGAGKEPEIQIIDGKMSMTAEAVPLGRLINLIDKAMGTTSQVKPELASRTISVQFSDLTVEDGIRKVFQGQPLNYFVIEGKGIRVTELVLGGPVTSPSPAPSYQEPLATNPFNQPAISPSPFQPNPPQAGAQPPNPNQQQPTVTIFGTRPDNNQNAPQPTYNNIPGGAALGNNPALSLSPPILGNQPAAGAQPGIMPGPQPGVLPGAQPGVLPGAQPGVVTPR